MRSEEPSVADSMAILQGLKATYEKHHHVQITDDAVETAVKMAHRYLTSRHLPDSAIDLLDEEDTSSIPSLIQVLVPQILISP